MDSEQEIWDQEPSWVRKSPSPELPSFSLGSAAFNLFCISAICVLAVASPQTKRIEAFKVFLVTAFFGTFAYIWVLIVGSSPR